MSTKTQQTTPIRKSTRKVSTDVPSQERDDVLLQVTSGVDDYFRKISSADLLKIARSKKSLKQKRDDVFSSSTAYAVTSTRAIDHVLVLDGIEDRTSWEELLDSLE